MTDGYTTEGITHVMALPDPAARPGQRWMVTFESSGSGLCHQLYANGRLVGWTDSPEDRTFVLDAAAVPQELAVAACPPSGRTADVSALLGLAGMGEGWLYRASFVRRSHHGAEDRLQVVDEGGNVLFEAPIWPAWWPMWSFGYDAFAHGGFGYDGALAPGLGEGGFAAGEFGFDGFALPVTVPLQREGRIELTFRILRPGAEPVAGETLTLLAAPPPAPPERLTFLSRDPQTGKVTLGIH